MSLLIDAIEGCIDLETLHLFAQNVQCWSHSRQALNAIFDKYNSFGPQAENNLPFNFGCDEFWEAVFGDSDVPYGQPGDILPRNFTLQVII